MRRSKGCGRCANELDEPSEGAPDFDALPSISGARLSLGREESEVRSRPSALTTAAISMEPIDLGATLLAAQRAQALSASLHQLIVDAQPPAHRAALSAHAPTLMAIDRALHAADLPPLIDQLRNHDLRLLQDLPGEQDQAVSLFLEAQWGTLGDARRDLTR